MLQNLSAVVLDAIVLAGTAASINSAANFLQIANFILTANPIGKKPLKTSVLLLDTSRNPRPNRVLFASFRQHR